MQLLVFVYVLHMRLEFEIKSSLDYIHPASDSSFGEGNKKNQLSLYFSKKQTQDPGPTETEKVHLLRKLPLVA